MHTFTRRQLYDLIWTDPISRVAKRLEISDVGLAKACRKKNIPRPPLGYWAKLRAGKKVQPTPLVPRGPGMSDEITIGKGCRGGGTYISDQELLQMELMAPVFDEDLEAIVEPVIKEIQKVAPTRDPSHAFAPISRYLAQDEERRQSLEGKTYISMWDKPIFDEPIEQRRLRILSGLFTALGKCGMKPSISGKEARETGVTINETWVSFSLDATSQREVHGRDAKILTRGDAKSLRLVIPGSWQEKAPYAVWEDKKGDKIERHLKDVAITLVRAGEDLYRRQETYKYERLIARRAAIIEQRERQAEEARREEEERKKRLEQARIDKLLGDAEDFRKADDIRKFVETIRGRLRSEVVKHDAQAITQWSEWALAQADALDPLRSGRLLEEVSQENIT